MLWATIARGSTSALGTGITHLMRDFREVEPTLFAGVPHLFETIWRQASTSSLTRALSGAARLERDVFDIALQASRAAQQGVSLNLRQRLMSAAIAPLLRHRIERLFGSRLTSLISGGRALDASCRRVLSRPRH